MDDCALELQTGEHLQRLGWRLAVAESCTGGLVGHRLTNISGSSLYFVGGIIAYANEAKMKLLGVNHETLELHGAVSRETVIEMAEGARKAFSVEVALAVSGIAGPGGGTTDKPVGLVWIGLCAPGYQEAWRYIWQGNRLQVKEQSAQQALQLLVNYLSGL